MQIEIVLLCIIDLQDSSIYYKKFKFTYHVSLWTLVNVKNISAGFDNYQLDPGIQGWGNKDNVVFTNFYKQIPSIDSISAWLEPFFGNN